MKSSKVLTAQLKLVAAIAVWGGSFIATKLAVGEVSPVVVVWSRFLIGLIILGWFAWRHGELAIPTWKDGLEFAFLGFMGITLHQWLQSSGLVTSEAATTAWIVSTTPVFMAVLGWLFLKERLGFVGTFGIVLATLGVLLVVSKGNFMGMFSGRFRAPGGYPHPHQCPQLGHLFGDVSPRAAKALRHQGHFLYPALRLAFHQPAVPGRTALA